LLYDRHQGLSIDSQFHEQENSCAFCAKQLITGALEGMCDNAAKTLGFNHLKHTVGMLKANKKSVGASLLAMTECQQTLKLTDIPQSRASSLPQGSVVWL